MIIRQKQIAVLLQGFSDSDVNRDDLIQIELIRERSFTLKTWGGRGGGSSVILHLGGGGGERGMNLVNFLGIASTRGPTKIGFPILRKRSK